MKSRSRHGGGRVGSGFVLLAVALTALLLSPLAVAQRMAGSGPAQGHGNASGPHHFNGGTGNVSSAHPRGPVRPMGVHPRHGPGWQGGRWFHGRHHGNFGWWWLAGGVWYWYPGPVYPYAGYPYPVYPYGYGPMAVANPAPDLQPAPTWYYCEDSGAYYPDVTTCPGGWTEIPAVPDQGPPIPQE